MEKLILTWDNLKLDVKTLAAELRTPSSWEGIVAVARGGVTPAALMAYELNIRVVETISLASYGDNHQRNELQLLKPPSDKLGDGKDWLVIDDLADTGETIRMVRLLLPRAHVAVVYVKSEGKPIVDTFVREVSQDTWIIFPWEES